MHVNLKIALRKWHRWIGFVASLFLLLASGTGVWLAGEQFFGADEALRERLRTVVSPVTTDSTRALGGGILERARAAVALRAPDAPIDKLVWEFKGDRPAIIFFLGKPTGGEDRKVTVDAGTSQVMSVETYEDKSFLLRLHSGEAFGDGGLVLSMLWGSALLLLAVTGLFIYFQLRRAKLTGWRRVFWSVGVYAVALSTAPKVRADSPFYTDDPNFSPSWEIKAGFTGEKNAGGSVMTDVLDWNYAVVPNVRLNLTTYGKHCWPKGSPSEFGYATPSSK